MNDVIDELAKVHPFVSFLKVGQDVSTGCFNDDDELMLQYLGNIIQTNFSKGSDLISLF